MSDACLSLSGLRVMPIHSHPLTDSVVNSALNADLLVGVGAELR